MSENQSLKVCVIGLGSMGLGVAGSLLRAGFDVVGCDVTDQARAGFSSLGGRVENTPAAASNRADVIISVVVNAAQTDAVLFGPDGAASAAAPGAVILSCATMAPDAAREFEARAQALGLSYIDAPISGGALRAAAGEMMIMASGAPAAFDKACPVLSCIAAKVYELGDAAGTGAAF